MKAHWSVFALAFVTAAVPAAGQSPAIRMGAACAPVGTAVQPDAPTVSREGELRKTLWTVGERVAVSAGAGQVQVGQKFFVRRAMKFHGAPEAAHTVGWLHIVEAGERSSTGVIDFTCDAIEAGDRLEPYAEPVLPPGIDRTDATGTPDFSQTARVLYGNDGRQMGGARDFMLASAGQNQGVKPGARYAVYRGLEGAATPPSALGEAIVVAVFSDKSVLRLTQASDAVTTGDTLVARVGGTGPMAEGAPGGQRPGAPASPAATRTADAGRTAGSRAAQEFVIEPVRTVTFEEVHFEFDRATLTASAKTILDGAAKTLQDNPTIQIRVEGHTCNIGGPKENLALSIRRANTVRDYLVVHGVAENRVTTVGFGEQQPKHENAQEETRKLNRRVALAVADPKAPSER